MTRQKRSGATKPSELNRRSFLQVATLATGAAIAPQVVGQAADGPSQAAEPDPGASLRRSAQVSSARWGSDYMIDMLRHVGIDYISATPSNTCKGLHESVVNYGMTSSPSVTLLTSLHEEVSVAMAHGYAKVAGKPMACMMHSTVGLQHGTMALYNAYADRVPVFALVGAVLDSQDRRGYVDWVHSVFDGPALVRDFTKWGDTPMSLGHFTESALRAHQFSLTPPYGPTVLALDQRLQEQSIPRDAPLTLPQYTPALPAQAADAAVAEAANLLVAAEQPVIVVDRAARTPAGLISIIALAEVLQAAVVDLCGRMNFPWRHPLNQTHRQVEALAAADVVLGLEVTDFSTVTRQAPPAAKTIRVSAVDLFMKSNYQDFNRYTPVALNLAADAEATLPALIEAVKRRIKQRDRSRFERRGQRLAEAHKTTLERSRRAAAVAWDVKPISVARLCQELYERIRSHDWALCNGTIFQSWWPQQLWHAEHHYQYIGDAGGYGLGYLPGAAVGAALAHRAHGRLSVAIGGDGDLMFVPGALWSAAHHRIPLLYVVHNNRAYHQEVMVTQTVANQRERGINRAQLGNAIADPSINLAMLARAMGVYAEGPIEEPGDLGPALERAVAIVARGEPALVDVVCQGR